MIAQRGRSLDRAVEEARRLGDLPTPDTARGLDRVLRAAFLDTQERTHVITGALRASGEVSSEVTGEGWHGRIAYGGPGLEQAVYEMARGAEHDFYSHLPEFEPEFEAAIDRGIRDAAR